MSAPPTDGGADIGLHLQPALYLLRMRGIL